MSGVQLDLDQPIVVFDPWPFVLGRLDITDVDHYWFTSDGTLHARLSNDEYVRSALYSENMPFMGTATDGLMVIGNYSELKLWLERR